MYNRLFIPVSVLALALAAASCGGDSGADETTTSSTAPVTTTTTAPSTTTTTTIATTTTLPPATTTTTLPGEPLDFGPRPGDVLGVVGIAFDDVLNLRAGPGTEFDVLKKLAARSDRVISNGRAQSIPGSIWYEVTSGGVTGWSSATFLAYLGATDDITAAVVESLDGSLQASTMEALGQAVADTYPEDEKRLRVRMSGAPSVGDLGEVIFDVVGFPDDSVYGQRLHVFGEPLEDGGFELKSVEATVLCSRGVTDEGLCI